MDTGKLIYRKPISGPLFQTKRKIWKEPTVNTTGEINPKNRHYLRGLDGKYGRWEKILRDILNSKLKIVQNKKWAESDTDDDDDDKEMSEETGLPTEYDTFERVERCVPIRTNPEEDTLQLHTDSEIPGENLQTQIRRSNRNSNRPNRYSSIHGKLLGVNLKCSMNIINNTCTVWNRHKGTPKTEVNHKLGDFLPWKILQH